MSRFDIVEPLGFDRELDVQVGNQSFKARLDLRTSAREGDFLNLCFDMDRAHFFDPETERGYLYRIYFIRIFVKNPGPEEPASV